MYYNFQKSSAKERDKMIFDRIENADSYSFGVKGWKDAVKLMKSFNPEDFVKGKTPFENGISLVGCEYETKPLENAKMEAHKKYADLMFMAEGEEFLLYTPTDTLKTTLTPYSESIEAALYAQNGNEAKLLLKKGYFAVFLPSDGHSAGVMTAAPEKVRRMVVKIPLD